MDRTPAQDHLPPSPAADTDVEVWDPDEHPVAVRHRTFKTRLTASVPGAVAGAFLICAMAFGATMQTTSAPGSGSAGDHAAKAAAGGDGGAPVLGANQAEQGRPGGDEPDARPAEDDVVPDWETPGADVPDTEPAPDPVAQAIALGLGLGDGGRVRLEWGACNVDAFTAWKIVRSTDDGATFPLGEHDSLIGVIETQGTHAYTDAGAPHGKKLWYAVFGLAGDGDARHVVCESAVRSIETPAESKPDPKPEPKPDPKPEPKPDGLGLTLAVKEGAISIDFTECTVDGADTYKVVRSSNESVSWPLGEGDTLIAAIGMDGKTATMDEHAPAGKKAWYRVFCVRHTADGYKVLTSSPVRSITAPAKDPAPEPKHMGIEVSLDGGHVVIHWTACGGEAFSHYRIVRMSGDTTKVIAEIENADTTTWVDETVEAGGTYKYMVQSKGLIEGSYVLLGSTDWAAVTVD